MQTYYYNDVSVLVGLWQSEKSVGGISFEYWYAFSMIFGGVGKFWLLGICLCFVSDVSHVEWMWDEMRSRSRFKGLYPQVFTVVSLGTAWERQKKVFRCNNLKLVSIGPTSNGGRSRRTQGGPWWPSWDQTAKPWSDEKRWSWFCFKVNRVLVPSECKSILVVWALQGVLADSGWYHPTANLSFNHTTECRSSHFCSDQN